MKSIKLDYSETFLLVKLLLLTTLLSMLLCYSSANEELVIQSSEINLFVW